MMSCEWSSAGGGISRGWLNLHLYFGFGGWKPREGSISDSI